MPKSFAKVRLLDAPFFLDRVYDYQIPETLSGAIRPGNFVTVPFGGGNRRRIGLVVALSDTADYETVKPVLSVSTPHMTLSEEMLGLVSFLRERTLCTTGEAVHAMIPGRALSDVAEKYRLSDKSVFDARNLSTQESFILSYLQKETCVGADALKAKFGPGTEESVRHLLRRGLLRREWGTREAMAEKEQTFFSLCVSPSDGEDTKSKGLRLGEKQRALLQLLSQGEKSDVEIRAAGFTKAQTDSLLEKKMIAARTERVSRDPYAGREMPGSGIPDGFVLNEEQEHARETISRLSSDGEGHAVLLHGVTGSGKTLVMLRVIDGVLASGRGVIVLLPEIALTPQSLSIFCSRYGKRVAVMHSGLGTGERLDTYRRIASGEADVVVGTRSAVFAPVSDLGLIVMDEEHEHTYKSDMNPKYHARDVARYRCAHHKAVLLLCSATPSLESYKRAVEGRYTLLRLTRRPQGSCLPDVTVADMRSEAGEGNLSPIGQKLTGLLSETVENGNQAILFLNRRGYNHVVSCRSCGQALTCSCCSVTLTYHTEPRAFDKGYLVCHFCGRRQPMPAKCPNCGSVHLARVGYGTQRVEEELGKLLPGRRILRMDTDTTGTRFSYDEMLGTFRRHEADVLLGTQMVTKGHDFPDVTLVGVLMADASLYLDDYRAAERTFSMLTQVIGRAGRAKKRGMAVIQTANPENEVLKLACAQDYQTFYEREIRLRRLLVFPPFCDIVLLTLSHGDERKLMVASGLLSDELSKRVAGEYSDVAMVAFGPFEAPVYRAEGKYRMRMVLKCVLNKRSRALFGELLAFFGKQSPDTPLLSVDFNPSTL